MGFAKWFDEQDKLIKILLMIPFWGWAVGAVYRVFKYIETKDTATLIGAILDVIPFTDLIMAIIDFVTVIINGKLTVLVAGGENFGIGESEKKSDSVDAEVKDVEEKDAE